MTIKLGQSEEAMNGWNSMKQKESFKFPPLEGLSLGNLSAEPLRVCPDNGDYGLSDNEIIAKYKMSNVKPYQAVKGFFDDSSMGVLHLLSQRTADINKIVKKQSYLPPTLSRKEFRTEDGLTFKLVGEGYEKYVRSITLHLDEVPSAFPQSSKLYKGLVPFGLEAGMKRKKLSDVFPDFSYEKKRMPDNKLLNEYLTIRISEHVYVFLMLRFYKDKLAEVTLAHELVETLMKSKNIQPVNKRIIRLEREQYLPPFGVSLIRP